MALPEPTTYTAERTVDQIGDEQTIEEVMLQLRDDLRAQAANDGRELAGEITVELVQDRDAAPPGQAMVRATALAAPIAKDSPAPKAPWRPKVLVDFDGVIHRYSKGWADGATYDPPMPGALEALEQMELDGYEVVIFSTRDADQIKAWLLVWRFPIYRVTNVKEPAVAQIDDRAIRFVDWGQAATDLRELHPVNHRG